MIDDGTATISAVSYVETSSSSSSSSSSSFSYPLALPIVPGSNTRLGDHVCVRGTVKTYRSQREIRLHQVVHLSSSQQEEPDSLAAATLSTILSEKKLRNR